MNRKQKTMLARILFSACLLGALAVADRLGFFKQIPDKIPVKFSLYLLDYLIIGYDILKKAFKGILHGRMLDENFLMAVATVGAFALSIFEAKGLGIEDCNEAVAVMLFYQVGEFFQRLAVGKSRKNISELMDIRPDYANILADGKLVQVAPESVQIGDEIIVQPGEKVPLDGFVIEGSSSLDTSSLTGESLPRTVSPGDEITSGSINQTGVLKIRTSKVFSESTASKILELVENASSRKSRSEEFISKFARIYTPAVVISALVLAIFPPLAGTLFFHNETGMWTSWIYRALTFLVISCPCALVISIPLSFFAGIGGASNQGILIKGSNFLETLSKTKTVVFDKTGTLTKGVFQVIDIHHSIIDEKKLLEFAALAECSSTHPISKSIVSAHGKEIDRSRVKNIEEIGKITGKEQKASEVVSEIKSKIDSFANSEVKGKKILGVFSSTPLTGFSSKTLPGDIFNKLGLKNIADNLEGSTPIVSTEFILTQDPDYIIVVGGMGGDGENFLKQNPVLKKTTAAKNDKILIVPSSLLLRGTPRIGEAVDKFYELLSK